MRELFEWESWIDARTLRARTLVVTIGSFIDAGNAQRQVQQHLSNVCSSRVLGSFDVDQLIDYRENRPGLTFDRDHVSDYRAPEMTLRELTDAHGEKFLLLSGAEPALRWEAVAAQIERIVAALEVELTVIVQAIPMMVPHTRPVPLTRHATSPELLPGNKPIFGIIAMSASFPLMLEYRLGTKGHDVVGLSAHVPHYLAQSDYPDAAVALLQGIREVAGLHVPMTELSVAAGVVQAQLTEHLAENEEFAQVVTALEEQYDDATEQRQLSIGESELPTADEIGAEAEKFLQFRSDDDASDD